MKKVYSKPVIIFESFQMTSNIANTCEDKIYSETTCFIEHGWDKFFTTGVTSVCTAEDVDCYHVPENNPNVFGS